MNFLFNMIQRVGGFFHYTLETQENMNFFERLVSGVEDVVNEALGVNLTDMLVQIGATIILVIIVKKYFWGRISEFLQKRQEYMDSELSDAEKAHEEAVALKETHDKELKEVRTKSKEYFESAKSRGEEEKKRIIDSAKSEADTIVANGVKEVESERKKAKEELKKEVVSIAALMTEKVIGKEIDKKAFLNETIKDIESSEEL